MAYFYLNPVCYFGSEHAKHIQIITWSNLPHPSFTKRSTVCIREVLEREHIMLQSVTTHSSLPSLSSCQLLHQKWQLFVEPGVQVSGQYCWDVFLSQQMLAAIKLGTNC